MLRLSKRGAILTALLLISLSTGCSSERVIAKPEVLRLKPPQNLLNCAPAPDPRLVSDDKSLAFYIADLEEAGESCRAAIEAIKAWSDLIN